MLVFSRSCCPKIMPRHWREKMKLLLTSDDILNIRVEIYYISYSVF